MTLNSNSPAVQDSPQSHYPVEQIAPDENQNAYLFYKAYKQYTNMAKNGSAVALFMGMLHYWCEVSPETGKARSKHKLKDGTPFVVRGIGYLMQEFNLTAQAARTVVKNAMALEIDGRPLVRVLVRDGDKKKTRCFALTTAAPSLEYPVSSNSIPCYEQQSTLLPETAYPVASNNKEIKGKNKWESKGDIKPRSPCGSPSTLVGKPTPTSTSAGSYATSNTPLPASPTGVPLPGPARPLPTGNADAAADTTAELRAIWEREAEHQGRALGCSDYAALKTLTLRIENEAKATPGFDPVTFIDWIFATGWRDLCEETGDESGNATPAQVAMRYYDLVRAYGAAIGAAQAMQMAAA